MGLEEMRATPENFFLYGTAAALVLMASFQGFGAGAEYGGAVIFAVE
jgi:hypothetical protein